MGRPRSRIARERKPVALVRDQPASAPVAYATEAAQAVRIGIPGSMATGRPESRWDSSAYRIGDGANALVPVIGGGLTPVMDKQTPQHLAHAASFFCSGVPWW